MKREHSTGSRLRIAALLCAIVGWPVAGAASLAEYRVTFDATWSAATHPGAYPPGAHFSGMVGGTHDDRVSFWDVGGLASEGIERMAESGLSAPLLAEVEMAIAAGNAWSTISASGGPSPGVRQTTFLMSSSHDRVTVVAMIAPSPDWFVGVTGLALRSGGAWQGEVVVDLPALDAGTDEGVDFTSPNHDTNPAEPIAGFTGPPFAATPALGTFTFELQGVVYGCGDGLDNDGDGAVDLEDVGCDSSGDDTETSPLLVCDDGLDNDGDGAVDLADAGCGSPGDAAETSPSLVCDDGFDNDGDTLVDWQDAGCADPLDTSEMSMRQCDDGLDNDADQLIDYPDDPECTSVRDNDEARLVPGLGASALVLLTAAMIGAAVTRVRRSAV